MDAKPLLRNSYTHYVAIDVGGLHWVEGRSGVFVIANDEPLVVADRIRGGGPIPSTNPA
jgi:hypothetical protein